MQSASNHEGSEDHDQRAHFPQQGRLPRENVKNYRRYAPTKGNQERKKREKEREKIENKRKRKRREKKKEKKKEK